MPAPPPIETDWLEAWAWPTGPGPQIALAAAVLLIVAGSFRGGARRLAGVIGEPSLLHLGHRRRFLGVVAAAAAFLSLGYMALYLQGGPRAPDAALYWLQGRALARGLLAWPAPEPLATFHTAGLVLPALDREAGPFSAGYPALLALGFWVGAPMVVGPVIAAGAVVATFWLGCELASSAGEPVFRADQVGRAAAGLSIVCAALRYHTADTLPFGAAALGVAAGVAAVLRACRTNDPRLFAAAGGALGAVAALQPAAAIAPIGVTAVLAIRRRVGWLAAASLFAAAVPGVVVAALTSRGGIAATIGADAGAHSAAAIAGRAFDLGRAHGLDIANF
ncbi:MAG: hypothetical protein FWD17_02720, partial [Polyangiaceae bacterium]|nr:hypothetical protein [Polyangiaceae bacterium]